jgi:dipeptidyl aminopeptidase/acylaminoacyl peptidase
MYLPPGFDIEKAEKLPMLMWAYPEEFKDKSSAGQVKNSPYEFTYPYYGSFVYWVNKGYIVLDDVSFPIIGEGEKEPNDSFIPQLVANAKAAIDAVDALGYVDRERVAVGGHSYGAFMTANLLTHSDLFAAGIARSGAYNRTLTPFGFQSEERNYWEAPEIYYNMGPFMHAEKMKHPLLLIHGGADNNSGTYTMQSERYFNALKGLGATTRLVILPKESHGYAAKESIMHMLWEQDQWLEKYMKDKKQ